MTQSLVSRFAFSLLATTLSLGLMTPAYASTAEEGFDDLTPLPMHAGNESFDEESAEFDTATAVSDEELSTQRGGFITMGGMLIEFGLTTRTLVDGVAQNDISINSENLQQITPDALRQVTQIGGGNNVGTLDALANNPGLLNVIQNSSNDKLIQNLSNLDIGVSNVATFKDQALTAIVDFQAVSALR